MRSVTIIMLAALCGGVGAGAYTFMAQDDTAPSGSTAQQPSNGDEAPVQVVAFTNADRGSCVDWRRNPDGQNSDFLTVDCQKPHRFEVSAREDLATYPSSEFGQDADQPDMERQAQLTQELCVGPTMRYLKGQLDPNGRYTISPILPPESAWDHGDRTMLCGVMVQDNAGMSVQTTGRAAQKDQSRVFRPDSCVLANRKGTRMTDCGKDHSWQITRQVDLGKIFQGSAWPSVEKQNHALNKVCTKAAEEYMGGEEKLYQSTLTPFWTTQPEESWATGSRQANCALMFSEGDGFATLKGDVRKGFTINGHPPKTPPKRLPLRDDKKETNRGGSHSGSAGSSSAGSSDSGSSSTGTGAQ